MSWFWMLEIQIIKAKIARREQGEIAFPHAIRQLSESEYEKILARAQINGNSKDYFRVNGNLMQ